MRRQVVLDTETTGLESEQGHRVIEIGAVELIDRKLTGETLHLYVDPERDIDAAAFEVHGLDAAKLAGKPKFASIAERFVNFIAGAELIIHNAPFDIAFLDYELSLLPGEKRRIKDICKGEPKDSLVIARRKHPGQKNSLDALCRRYQVDASARELHGALVDAEILADVYLAMTGGQLSLFGDGENTGAAAAEIIRLPEDRPPIPVILATDAELRAHEAYLDKLDEIARGGALWRRV